MDIEHVNWVRNLGAWFDSMLSMGTHINKVCSSGFYYLHNLRRIRKYLSQDCLVTLIHAFVTGRLDYWNSFTYGLPQCQISKLQRVQNAVARIALDLSKFMGKAKTQTSLADSGRKNVMSMRELFCPDPRAGFEKMARFQIFYCLKIKCFRS